MSLKSLIQWLLDSRTTPEEAGHSAMPSSAPTTISSPTSITSWGTIATFTAPGDGYVTLRGRSIEAAAAQIATLPLENNPTIITATQDNYQGMSCNLPVVKGKVIEVYGSNIENIVVSFNRLIGGGDSILLWRALSCLRALSNYLPRSSCKVKNNGSAAKHSLKQLLHWMFRHVPSLHRLMGILDTSTLSAVEANSCSIWIRVKKYLAVKSLVIAGFLQQIPTARQQYLSRKAVLLLLLPMRCSIKFGLLRLQARHNLRTGGALC
mgnify:CR=1 FL=1